MSAPVCHVKPEVAEPQPPAPNLPAIPIAQPNLASLTNSVNAMRALLMQLTGQNETNNGTGPRTISQGFTSRTPKQKVQWTELSRKTQKVRIYQNDDETSENYIDVEQINQLVMRDKNTGQVWTWDRKRR